MSGEPGLVPLRWGRTATLLLVTRVQAKGRSPQSPALCGAQMRRAALMVCRACPPARQGPGLGRAAPAQPLHRGPRVRACVAGVAGPFLTLQISSVLGEEPTASTLKDVPWLCDSCFETGSLGSQSLPCWAGTCSPPASASAQSLVLRRWTHCIVQAGCGLTVSRSVALSSVLSSCLSLCLPSSGIPGFCHCVWFFLNFNFSLFLQ